MDLKHALKKLEENPDFNKWHSKNKDTYFSYAFKIPQEMGTDEWQLGFYDRKSDKITTFTMAGGSVNIRLEEEIFKKDEMDVNKVELANVKLTFDNVVSRANDFQQSNFPKDKSLKTIAILQNITGFGNIWNITFITEIFNTLNIKIDASSGKIIGHNLSSVFAFRDIDKKQNK